MRIVRASAILTLAVLGAAGVFFLIAPPAPERLADPGWTALRARTVAGAIHVHSTRSDGHGDRAQIAAAAARSGLKFVIVTDHGDATRPPDPPAYLSGVLVLDAVEISTDDGHYLAIDMPRAPYPLGGAGDAVVEDVRRLGGFGIAAHPDSPKPALRWTAAAIPDGLEWLNLDSAWRDDSRAALVRAGLAYFLRPSPALALLLDRPPTLARWDQLTRERRVVAVAGVDAHGGVGRRAEDADSPRSLAGTIGIPSYASSFATMSNHVVLDAPLQGDPAADARGIYTAVREGRVFTAVDALAAPALLDFGADTPAGHVPMGSVLPRGSAATLLARATMPAGGELILLHDGQVIATTRGGELRYPVSGGAGAFRVEVHLAAGSDATRVPWIVSNPIVFAEHINREPPEAPPASAAGAAIAPFPWRIEKDPSSSGILRSSSQDATLEFKLGAGARESQFVALASDLRGEAFDAIELGLAADRPCRVSVQLRTVEGKRWGRSYYVDPAGSRLHVRVGDLRPLDSGHAGALAPSLAQSLLLVMDLTNANPGRSGTLRVTSSALVR
jgi:hypothetical protein